MSRWFVFDHKIASEISDKLHATHPHTSAFSDMFVSFREALEHVTYDKADCWYVYVADDAKTKYWVYDEDGAYQFEVKL